MVQWKFSVDGRKGRVAGRVKVRVRGRVKQRTGDLEWLNEGLGSGEQTQWSADE